MAYGLLAYVSKHSVCAAEGDDRGLAEQDADVDEGVVPAPPESDDDKGQRPQD
jgi:hypothetical protein